MAYPVIYLKCTNPDRLEKFPLGKGSKVSVGRDPSCDIAIDIKHVSSFHLMIICDAAGEVVCVDSSRNGTFINSKRISVETPYVIEQKLTVIDLLMGVELIICYDRNEEISFLKHIGITKASDRYYDYINDSKATPSNELDLKEVLPVDSSPEETVNVKVGSSSRGATVILETDHGSVDFYKGSTRRISLDENTVTALIVVVIGMVFLLILYGRSLFDYFFSK